MRSAPRSTRCRREHEHHHRHETETAPCAWCCLLRSSPVGKAAGSAPARWPAGASTLAQAPTCNQCDGSGWARTKDPRGIARVSRCSCWLAKQDTFAAGVPIEFRDSQLGNYQETPSNRHALDFARRWIADGARDVYVWGPVGTGKTRLAASLLNEVFRSLRAGYFVRVPMLLLRLQPSDVEHSDLFWRCSETPVLVLDDLGAERETATDFTRRTLLMLYEERGDRGLRTIWTSNKSLSELGDFMQDERLVSRIAGRADILKLAGADWRVSQRAR